MKFRYIQTPVLFHQTIQLHAFQNYQLYTTLRIPSTILPYNRQQFKALLTCHRYTRVHSLIFDLSLSASNPQRKLQCDIYTYIEESFFPIKYPRDISSYKPNRASNARANSREVCRRREPLSAGDKPQPRTL